MPRRLRFIVAIAAAWAWAVGSASIAMACSPPMDPPTIRDLGPDRVVLIGTTGDPAPGGRWFHVERWFGAGVPVPAVVIAFQEGEAIGDCSYPVAKGEHRIIAPEIGEGRLSADLLTIQADPDSALGQGYLADTIAVFGPGVVPEPEAPAEASSSFALDPGVALPMLVAAIGGIIGLVAFIGDPRRRSR